MSDQSEARVWYMHRNGLKEGPLTLTEMLGRKKDGILRPDTQVWRDGMAGWVAAASVQDLKDAGSGGGRYQVARGSGDETGMLTRDHEKSLVLELQRGVADVQDQTTAIDRNLLRRAKSEALQVARLERKQGGRRMGGVRGALVGSQSRGLGWKMYATVLPMLAVVALAGGLRLGVVPTSFLGSEIQPWLDRYFSFVPDLNGVSVQTLAELRAALRVPADQLGLAVAIVPEHPDHVLFVAGNLPNGTALRIGIRGVTDPSMEVTFPIHLQGGVARSRGLQDIRGRKLGAGRYLVFVVDGEESEQSPGALAWLRAWSPAAAQSGVGRLPAGMPSQSKFTWTKEIFVP